MNYGSLIISGAALIVSMISFYFTRKSWRETNRPIVTVRVTTNSRGNTGASLDILVENTGNRPAKNVKLTVDRENLNAVLITDNENFRNTIENCFSERGVIPVLANGRFVTNSFGYLSRSPNQEDWINHSRLEITVDYEDLNGRRFNYKVPILIADDSGFAGGFWVSEKKSN